VLKDEKKNDLFEVKHPNNCLRTSLLFIQTSELVLKYLEATLNKTGLSLVKLMVLQLLETHGGKMKPSVIARLTNRERHDITSLMRRMQKDQLIALTANERDRRSIYIDITDKGKQAVINTVPIAVQAMKQAMSSISDPSMADMETTLRTMKQNTYNGLKSFKNLA
jgi:DNA-binding MarR family transcriptional regulator